MGQQVDMNTSRSHWPSKRGNLTAAVIILAGMVVLAIVGAFVCALCLIFAYLWAYPAYPWPSPHPYPGVEASVTEGSPGSWGLARTYEYQVDLSLEEIQQYYEKEMNQYCESEWAFEEVKYFEGFLHCRTAWCEIPRLWLGQSFHVDLCLVGEAQTKVFHTDFWQD